MSSILRILGIINMIVTIITGIFGASETDSLLVFTVCLLSGIAQVIVYYAAAMALDNQADLKSRLYHVEELLQSQKKETGEKRKCPSCGRNYETDRTSCPYCGHKE